MPLFEAVQNSIHAIDEAESLVANGQIVVQIIRDSQSTMDYGDSAQKPGPDTLPEITGFKIKDNGIGFTNANMKSFETLDSDLKANIGGRGVGRLLWLKAFESASIQSIFQDGDGAKKTRSFRFTAKNGVSGVKLGDANAADATGATAYLQGFDTKYRDASRKTAESIATSIFEHCLWYFVRQGSVPAIIVKDDEETISLDDVYHHHMHSSAETESIKIKGSSFELTHIELHSTTAKSHFIGWCASNRLVDEENITGKIPGLYSRLDHDGDPFVYACYVTSDYLDERVRPERTGFVIEKNDSAGLFSSSEISQSELTNTVLERTAIYLSTYLDTNRKAGLDRVHRFVAEQKPRYRPLLARIPEDQLYVDPKISDRDLDIVLHKHKSEAEAVLLSAGQEIMRPKDGENYEDYEDRVRDYLSLADDLKKSDLAEYVSHRKVILDFLKIAIEKGEDGKYAREDLIHELIMPMREVSNSVGFERSNLWLVDERLTFHDFLASDKTLNSMPITENRETKRPDIIALNVYDQPLLLSEGQDLPLASIVVVEIKRPMRDDAAAGEEHDPIEQSLGYLKRIRAGEVKTATGRPIPDSPDIPGFCFVVCDITPTIKERCEIVGLTITSDHMGYFGYNPTLKAYIEVISFDQLLKAATERNRAFFDKLGLPTS